MLLDAVPEEDEDSSTDKVPIAKNVTVEHHLEPHASAPTHTEGLAML